MKKKFKRKLFLTLSLILCCLVMSGCGQKLTSYVEEDLSQRMRERIQANQTIAQQLFDSNFISADTFKKIKANLDKQEVKYEAEFKKLQDSKDPNKVSFLKAVSKYSTIDGAEIHAYSGRPKMTVDDGSEIDVCTPPSDGSTCPHTSFLSVDDLKGYLLPNFLTSSEGGSIWTSKDAKTIFTRTSAEAIVLLDDGMADEVNSKFDYDVYVLSPNILTSDGSGSIDGIMALLQSSIKTDGKGTTITNIGTLNNYFVPALDENKDPVKLIEMTKDKHNKYIMPDEFKIIQESKPANEIDSPELSGYKTFDAPSEPGYDMIVSQDKVPCMTLKFSEFNKEAIDNLNKLVGFNDGKYVFYTHGDTKRVYLLEYPVSILGSIKADSSDKNKIIGTLNNNSGLGINLYTGKIIKYDPDGKGGWLASGTPVNESVDKYLTTTAASSNNEAGQSSFIIKGMTTTKISHSLVNSGKARTVPCGRIILRDYLEATFAPGFVPDENVAVFGRKLRLVFNNWDEGDFKFNGKVHANRQFTPYWNKTEDMAYFVDKEGKKIETSPSLQITDFASFGSLLEKDYSKCQVTSIVCKGEATKQTKSKVESGELPTIDDLSHKTVESVSISISRYFPSEKIGKEDFNSDTDMKQRFWCIATTKNMFESGLFSDWINSKSSTASLQWWNQYLHDNGFIYTADQQTVNEYLKSNYAYELSQNGIIVLDLQTVADIQEMFDKDADVERGKTIRTAFMIVGWLIIIYAMILLLSWGVDTNADIGVKLLEKLTFGHWVAVKYESDIPYNNANGSVYVTGGKIFFKCIILIFTGLVLIYVNILNVVLTVIQIFAPFARAIEKVIQGLK